MMVPPNFQPLSSTGLIPICDLQGMTFSGREGGLYPGGSNQPDAAYHQMGMDMAARVFPRDRNGHPDPLGRIVLLAVGMSNTGHYFDAFTRRLSAAHPLADGVVLVNAALEGKDLRDIASSGDPYWRYVDHRLKEAACSPAQVQAVWLMQARHGKGIRHGEGMAHIEKSASRFGQIYMVLSERFPQLSILLSAGREYGGYNPPGEGNPEPYAYYTGWAWKHLIEGKAAGTLPTPGASSGPWIGWSDYFWADGICPRSDGMTWETDDFQEDGVHPSPQGMDKAASLLLTFFTTSPYTTWLIRSS